MAREKSLRLRIVSMTRPVGSSSGAWETTEYYTDAKYTREGDRVDISYRESEESGLGNTRTHFTFCVGDEKNVTLRRRGDVNNTMEFSPRTKKTILYNTGVFPIELQLMTLDVENDVSDEGGSITVSYYLRVGGDAYNHFKISVYVI